MQPNTKNAHIPVTCTFEHMKRTIILGICLLVSLGPHAQDIIGMGTRWSDSFREWEVHTPNEWRTGTLQLRWNFREDWTEWDFRLGDTTAQIRLKWRDDPNLWEIKCLGKTVTARTVWSGDFRQWRISDGDRQLHWQSRFGNVRDEWILRNSAHGDFTVYAFWEGDPREWVIVDDLDAGVSYAMRLALIFIAVFNSVPKV